MKRTITIGDKYKALMSYYEMNYDKDEFNHLITKLLISYKKMKGKDIDIIMLADLMENYDVNIFDFMSYISSCKKNDNPKEDLSEMVIDTDLTKSNKREEGLKKASDLIKEKYDAKNKEKSNIFLEKFEENKTSEKIEENNDYNSILDMKPNNIKSNNFAPILDLGIDLS